MYARYFSTRAELQDIAWIMETDSFILSSSHMKMKPMWPSYGYPLSQKRGGVYKNLIEKKMIAKHNETM